MNSIEKAVNQIADKLAAENKADLQAVSKSDIIETLVEIDSFKQIPENPTGLTGGESLSAHTPNATKINLFNTISVHIPIKKLRSMGMVTPDQPRSAVSEQYRSIKRPLLKHMNDREVSGIDLSNIIMVTSSIEGEGKTFTALNLAMSIAAERDITVLLVDSDVVKSSLGSMVGIHKDHPGLIDVLLGNMSDIGDAILQTDIPNLRFIPSGCSHDHATELLASQSMKDVVQELSHRYPDRVVIFDAPPMLQTNEAKVLANLVGQLVFVVAAESTSQESVTEALSHIDKYISVGLVLNKSRTKNNNGYGYDYGFEERKKSASSR